MAPSIAAMPTAVTTNQMPLCSATPWMPAFCMNLIATMYADTPPANAGQGGEAHLEVELALRPGAARR